MILAKQSTAVALIVGPILDSAGAEYTGAVIGDLSISKNGGTLTALAAAATLAHIANGQYTLTLIAGNVDTLGVIQITCNKATYQMPTAERQVIPATVYDALVTNVTTAAGGLGDIQRIAGIVQTGRDIGASVLLSSGFGPGQIALSGGKVDLVSAPNPSAVTAIQAGLGTAANQTTINANVTTVYNRIGAPAGASVSADIAAVKTDTGNLVTRITSTLFSGITSLGNWLGLLAGKTADAGTLAEMNATTAGATFANTNNSLEAIRDRGDAAWITGGSTITNNVVVPSAVAVASADVNTITAIRGDTLRRAFKDLGDISTRTKLWFTVKSDYGDEDSAAILQITEAGGLLTLNGAAAPDSSLGSITVDDAATGDITIFVDETIMAGLTVGRLFYDVQWKSATDTSTPTTGSFDVVRDVTKATS